MVVLNWRQRIDPLDICVCFFLATDCHVGFLEKDPIRGQDSFVTFEEILKHAVNYDVSFLLNLRYVYEIFSKEKYYIDSRYEGDLIIKDFSDYDLIAQINFVV